MPVKSVADSKSNSTGNIGERSVVQVEQNKRKRTRSRSVMDK